MFENIFLMFDFPEVEELDSSAVLLTFFSRSRFFNLGFFAFSKIIRKEIKVIPVYMSSCYADYMFYANYKIQKIIFNHHFMAYLNEIYAHLAHLPFHHRIFPGHLQRTVTKAFDNIYINVSAPYSFPNIKNILYL